MLLATPTTVRAQAETAAEPIAATGPYGLDCESRRLGDYFYCEPEDPSPSDPEPDDPIQAVPLSPTPEPDRPPEIAALRAYQADLEEARMVAVWNPTPENLRHYQELQLLTLEKSERFADAFMVNTWQVPGLAYDSTVPVNSLGASAYKAERRSAQTAHLRAAGQRYGLMYFYASSCGACRVFSPVLREFAQLYGFDVMAISMDGQPSPTFPDWRLDNGIAREVGLERGVTPAVVLFDAQTAQTIPLGFGVMGRDDLELRAFELTGGRFDGFTGSLETRP
ncbi:MAG: conjugal transfer protein TraF [Litorimonas sp.]